MKKFYLNQSGHRWRNYYQFDKLVPEKIAVFFPEIELVKLYTVTYWEAIGNFAVPYCRIKGKLEQLTEATREGCFMINSQKNRDIKWGRI